MINIAQIGMLLSSASGGVVVLPDYIGSNLYDEWYGNYGLTVRGTPTWGNIEDWFGYRNGERLDRGTGTTWAKPSGGIFTKTTGTGPIIRNRSTGINSSFTICAIIKKDVFVGSRVTLLDAPSDSPALRIDLERGSSQPNVAVVYAGTTYDLGVQFPTDGNFHTVVFVIDTAGILRYYRDGVQYGGNVSIAAGGINWTATNTSRTFFGFQFQGAYKKIRIYKEAVSDANCQIIGNNANAFFVDYLVTHRPVVVVHRGGQSNQVGSTMVASNYPAYLQAQMTTAYNFSISAAAGTRQYNLILAGTSFGGNCGPGLASSWKLQSEYPNADIIVHQTATASQSLDVYFNSRTNGTGWAALTNTWAALESVLGIEGRTIQLIVFSFIQGEQDSDAGELIAVAKRYNHYFEQVNNNGGNIQLQFNGVDKTTDFVVGQNIWILSDNGLYSVQAQITASTFSTNTLVTVSSSYLGAAPGGSTDRGNLRNLFDDAVATLDVNYFLDVRVPHGTASPVTVPNKAIVRQGKNVMVLSDSRYKQLDVDNLTTYPLQAVGNLHFNAVGYENIGLNEVDLIP